MKAETKFDVAAVIADHQRMISAGGPCWCGGWPNDSRDETWMAHLAAAISAHIAETLGSSEAREAAARAIAELEPGEEWPTNEALGGSLTGTRDDEYRDSLLDEATVVLAAVGDLLGVEVGR